MCLSDSCAPLALLEASPDVGTEEHEEKNIHCIVSHEGGADIGSH